MSVLNLITVSKNVNVSRFSSFQTKVHSFTSTLRNNNFQYYEKQALAKKYKKEEINDENQKIGVQERNHCQSRQ